MRFIISEGKIIDKTDYSVPDIHFGRAIHISQEVWYGYGGIPLFQENLNLLKRQAEVSGIGFPAEFENQRELFRLVKRMLNKNRFYRSGYLLFQIFAGEDSHHTLVSSTTFADFIFPFSDEGVLAGFSAHRKYTPNTMNRWPFFNEKLWQAALSEFQNTPVQQAIILNDRGSVCESAFSNLFLVAGNELKTPSYLSGCHENALRVILIKAAEKLGLKPVEKPFISREEIFEADEFFCASEAIGIQWVMGIENQRYIHYFSARIAEEINTLLKSKASSHLL